MPSSGTFTIAEPAETPWLGVVFGDVAMVPFAVGTLAFWLTEGPWRGAALGITLFRGCAILTSLAGVRRGVSFRTPGGVTAARIAGYLGRDVCDPIAARRLEAPLDSARLRPVRMAVPVLCLAATLVLLLVR